MLGFPLNISLFFFFPSQTQIIRVVPNYFFQLDRDEQFTSETEGFFKQCFLSNTDPSNPHARVIIRASPPPSKRRNSNLGKGCSRVFRKLPLSFHYDCGTAHWCFYVNGLSFSVTQIVS